MSESAQALPTQRARQRYETRNRVFEAAIAEFKRAGFANAQIDRIAASAGVVRGTFYFHFPTKEHVLLELQSREQARLLARLVALREQKPSVRVILSAYVDGIIAVERSVDDPGLMRDMLAMYVRQPVSPASAELAVPIIEELQHHLAGAAARGEIRAELGVEQLASLFLTSVFGLLITQPAAPEERRSVLHSLIDVFLHGVACDGGSSAGHRVVRRGKSPRVKKGPAIRS
jgi:AcrR family transcriptional regulator